MRHPSRLGQSFLGTRLQIVLSLAQKILKSKRPVVLFHTWTVTRELLAQAIREKRSMDLDVCVDDSGNAYLGHSKEYHDKTHEPFFNSMPVGISLSTTFELSNGCPSSAA
jgi:hypothetical protein